MYPAKRWLDSATVCMFALYHMVAQLALTYERDVWGVNTSGA